MLKTIIVEDEAVIRRGLALTIDWQALGCELAGEAADGEEGLELIEQEQPDLVLTDIMMPRLDGLKMAEQAREKGFAGEVVFLTSYAEFDYAKRALELRAADYLLKPVDEEELAALLQKLQQKNCQPQAACRLLDWQELLGKVHNPYVLETLQQIQRSYARRLSSEALAAEAGVSTSYLSRKLKEETGMTFGELLARQRLQQALGDMSTGRFRAYEAAEANGFTDYKHFCAVCQRYLNMSPKAFLAGREE